MSYVPHRGTRARSEIKSKATGEDKKLWYPVHAFQHTRLREIASPRQFPRLHSVVPLNPNTPIRTMIGQENFTHLTIHQPYQRQRIATVGLAVSVQGSAATSTMSDRPLNGSLLRLVRPGFRLNSTANRSDCSRPPSSNPKHLGSWVLCYDVYVKKPSVQWSLSTGYSLIVNETDTSSTISGASLKPG